MQVSRGARYPLAVVAGILALALVASFGALSAGASLSSQVIGGTRPVSVDVSGTRVVWADRADASAKWDVFLYDGVTGMTARITDGARDDLQPAIDGDTIVWVSYSEVGTGADIHAYDIPSRTYRVICANPGDQVSPDISGRWVVWEDRSTGYAPSVKAFDLVEGVQFNVASSQNQPKRAPRAGGDLVVYEDYPRGSAADADVVVYDLASRALVRRIGDASASELKPSTDGRSVVWGRIDGAGASDVWGVDLADASGDEFLVAGGTGEQALPELAAGTAYWVENVAASRLHVRSRTLPDGEARVVNMFGVGRGAVSSFAVAGDSVAWIENAGPGRQVRAILGSPSMGASMLSSLLPASPAWLPFRLAQVSTGGDVEAPTVLAASVDPGETFVDPEAPVSVTFSKPLDPTSAGPDSVKLLSVTSGEPVPASVSYSALSRSVVVEPDEPLAEGSYTLLIEDSVSDTAGNPLDEPVELSFATTAEVTDTLRPRPPGAGGARVAADHGVDAVEVSWAKPWDDVGVTEYSVYTHTAPVTIALIDSIPLVPETIAAAPGVEVGELESAIISVSGARDKKYTYYYAIRARDGAGNVSLLSANRVADPHGTAGTSVSTCTMCHGVHGSSGGLGAGSLTPRSAEACFTCHGNTAYATAYGHASSMNTQASFFSYAEDPLPEGGSQHRNEFMVSQQQECDACHSPHRKPYDTNLALSYSKLLRYQTGLGLAYNTDAQPFGNEFCFSCHGSEVLIIAGVGGMDAYTRTAGDHNQDAFDSDPLVAHGSANVGPTRDASERGPQISCTACHNEHASPVARLIDYRGQSDAGTTFGQADLCYACHSSASTETRSAGSAPYAWNDRDVKAEFERESSHPMVADSGSGASVTCYSCHNTHYVETGTGVWDMSRVSDPRNTLNTVTTSSTSFCLSCHGNNPPQADVSASSLVPYTIAFRAMNGSAYPYFAGWNKQRSGLTFGASTHATTAGTRAVCENCHDPHGSDFDSLIAWTRPAGFATGIAGERENETTGPLGTTNICYQCHGDGTIGRTASVGAGSTTRMNVATPANLAFGHTVSTSQIGVDANHSNLEGAADLGAGNRHSECVDCHDPHIARKTPERTDSLHVPGSSVAGGALYGAIGVKPTWTGAGLGASVSYEEITLAGASTDYEAYLCFKCHTSYTTLPAGNGSGGYPTQDRAYEFNPNNASGHNVLGNVWPKTSFVVGGITYSFGFPANVFKDGWDADSMMTCSDCHTYSAGGARGPHGSSVAMGIDSGYTYDWKQSGLTTGITGGMTRGPSGERAICEKCHHDLRSANNVHNMLLRHGADYGVRCVHCHVKVPHGWDRPRLLGYRSDPEPYRVVAGGVTAIALKDYPDPNGWVRADCQAGCATQHSTAPSPAWP